MTFDTAAVRQRLGTGLIVGLLHVAVIYGLLVAFAGGRLVPSADDLALVATFVTDRKPPPPPPPPPRHPAQKKAGGDPRPPAKKATAAPVIAAAVIPVMRPAPPTRVTGNGAQQNNGSALAGAGSGGGGEGSGTGSGSGDGDDGGTDLRQIAGAITDRDYPREAYCADQGGKVYFSFTVGIDGRVSDCEVTRSSGSPALDAATCRLIVQRFRYEPSRDSHGRPYADTVDGVHEWTTGKRLSGGRDRECD